MLGVRNLLMVPRGNESVFRLSTEAYVSVSVGLPRDKVTHPGSAFISVVILRITWNSDKARDKHS